MITMGKKDGGDPRRTRLNYRKQILSLSNLKKWAFDSIIVFFCLSNLFSAQADDTAKVLQKTDRALPQPVKALGQADVVLVGKTFHVKKHFGGHFNVLQTAFLNGMGYIWAIEGECISACTQAAEVMGCVSEGARMGYHSGYHLLNKTWDPRYDLYRPELVEYINSKGGFPETSNYNELTWLEGDELDRFFPRCAS